MGPPELDIEAVSVSQVAAQFRSGRRRGRPSQGTAILQAYDEIEKDFAAPMKAHFEPIRRRAMEILGTKRDTGLGDEATLAIFADSWINSAQTIRRW